MSPGSNTVSYPAFVRIGLRENPGKNLNQGIPLKPDCRIKNYSLRFRPAQGLRSPSRFTAHERNADISCALYKGGLEEGIPPDCTVAVVCVRICVSIRRPEFECSGSQLEGPEFECSGPQLEGPEFEYSELSLK
ncbi:hypothetical protein ANN_01741, partial [Periplaneta americana]